jgi:hypothetical protein
MKIAEFIENFKTARIQNSKVNPNAVSEYITKELEIKTYIPFREKRKIAEMIVEQNISVVDGIKKYDDISSYVSLVVASIAAHTNLQFGEDPVADYDLLAESGLLPQIIAEFQDSHEEIGILLKMAIASELEGNNVNVLIGHFLDNILQKLRELDFSKIFGGEIKEEDVAKLNGLFDKLK